jgi:OmpA-OmpF porin, OOP family
MKKLALAAAMAVVMTPAFANAEVREGWYIGAGALAHKPVESSAGIAGTTNKLKYNWGWGTGLFGGYAWGNGFRTEGEFFYRRADVRSLSGAGVGAPNGELINMDIMGNLLYDFEVTEWFMPYLGAGLGIGVVDGENLKTLTGGRILNSTHTKFTYQGIAGLGFMIDPNWYLFVDYRFVGTNSPKFKSNLGDRADSTNRSHNLMFGFRFHFDTPAEMPPAPLPMPAQLRPAPMPQPRPMARPVVPAVPQTYMVFFDFDKSVLTPEAKRIIASAAQEYQRGRYVRLNVTGHTDTSGTNMYNKRLSERRSTIVEQELARLGVPTSDMASSSVGESSPMIPTADGVRESQNRRTEITLSK